MLDLASALPRGYDFSLFRFPTGAKKRKKRSTPCFPFNMPNTCNNCKSQITYLEFRYHYVQRCFEILKHAQACRDQGRDAECNLPKSISWRCLMMKRVLMHADRCRRIRRNVYNCIMCKQLIDFVFNYITLSISLPRQVRDEAATIAVTMTITTSTFCSAGQSADKQFALSKPEYQQLMQITDADTPDRQKKMFQILKCNPSFIAAFTIVEYLQQFGQHGGRVGDPLGPNQPQQQPE
ncbi:uncharacterized protein LOC143904703 isoform X2 [Temnothorax americanus]|uniref:uncharacterized protein LOC143904703 isoform X2 n=1 Tax=Temnothorax americanus TaxID=1964332 RepID=UPI004068199C